MDQTTLKIALAALLHDIGKFAQGCLDVSKEYLANNAGQYQPFRNGRHTHIHSIYTAAFIEQLADRLPPKLAQTDWGEGDSFINLAAGHHNPETPMQWVVAQADRISSGLDRAKFDKGEDIAWQDFKRTRLLPVLEALGVEKCQNFNSRDSFQWRYPLAPVSAESIFPVKESGEKNKNDAVNEYKQLFDIFVNNLKGLYHRESSIELWCQHFDSLLLTYTSHIPAARVGDVVHDVSLYDHSRSASAIASALYLYHKQQNTLEAKAIQDNSLKKMLVVTGDFYGIQDFIFSSAGEKRRYRSKILRGRSFAVSLFSELASEMLCRELNLTPFSVVLNAAGKFTLIAPNTEEAKETISKVEKKINDWLFSISYGQSSIGITATPASPEQFMSGAFSALWNDIHVKDLDKTKFQKLDLNVCGGVVRGYLDSFNNKLDSPLCPFCGQRPSAVEAEKDFKYLDGEGSSCRVCRDHIMLGTHLVKGKRLAVLSDTVGVAKKERLLAPIFGRYQLVFTNDPMEEEAARGELLNLWDLNVEADGTLPVQSTCRIINGYVPLYHSQDEHDDCLLLSRRSEEKTFDLIDMIKEGVPKTFSHIACKAKHLNTGSGKCEGTEALGILKADIDNLGILMGCGLTDERFTLSRLATLSRQLNNFFTVYLPLVLKNEFKEVYTVFAGGDDVFLIGPWNNMAKLALYLRKQFAQYVCENDELSFSAGISVQKSHVPVDKLAEAAEEALESAKGMDNKNAVSMFGSTVSWEEFELLMACRATMQSWIETGMIGKAMMYRFNYLVSMAEQEKRVREQEKISMQDLECLKWRSMFKYSLTRNIHSSVKGKDRERAMQEISVMADWLDRYGGAVRIPLWQLLYDQR